MSKEIKLSSFELFTNEFSKLASPIILGIENSNTDADFKNNAKSFLDPFKEQFASLSNYLIEASKNSSNENLNSANQLVEMGAGNQMITTAKSITKNLKSIFSKLALSDIIREIKKLIFFLLDLFKAPKWVYTVILLIDQFLNALLGWDLPETMDEVLSRREVNFYREIREHKSTVNVFVGEDND